MARLSVLVCRDCCCGSDPDVDHDGQIAELRAALPDGGRLWQVDCLGPCEAANVIVVRSSAGRRWFGRILAPSQTTELAGWVSAGAPDPLPVGLQRLLIDPDDIDIEFGQLDTTPDTLAALVAESLEARTGAWSMGVLGATGEWVADAATEVANPSPRCFEARTQDGSLILAIEDSTRAYASRRRDGRVSRVVFASPLVPVRDVVADLGTHGEGRLIDLGLGIGSCTFAIVVDDRLSALVRPFLGRRWDVLLDAVGSEIVAASPVRVITTPMGRMEIRSPIPPPDGRSPDGSHTHLRPAELELGRELLTGFVIAEHLSVGVTFHPPPAWCPRIGWPEPLA